MGDLRVERIGQVVVHGHSGEAPENPIGITRF